MLGLFNKTSKLVVVLLLSVIFASFNFPKDSPRSYAETDISPWMAPGSPTLKNINLDLPFDQVPSRVYGSQECLSLKKFIIKPAKSINPLNPFGQTEASFSICGVNTQFGTLGNNYLSRSGSNIAGKVYSETGSEIKLAGIPNSNNAITSDKSAPTGVYIDIEKNIDQRLTTSPNKITGEVKHILEAGSSQRVKDEQGNSLAIMSSAGGFSSNGNWVVFDAPYIGLVRLDVESGNILIFDKGYRYDIGLTPSLQMAVSNSGRYVAVVSGTYNTFKIYDLDTCVRSTTLNKPASCQSRDLKSVLTTEMPDSVGIGTILSFTDEYTLKFYGATKNSNVTKRQSQLLTAYGEAPVEFPYLALGDSFASGEGAYSYKAGTDVKNPKNKCHLSVSSYSFLIARDLGLGKAESIACSGAKIKDLDGQYVKNGDYSNEGRQAFGLENPVYDDYVKENFLPGYRKQLDFVEKYKPDKITFSISGNDIGFSDIIKSCIYWGDCYSTTEERVKLVDTINQRFGELTELFKQIKTISPTTTVYVVGYPRLVDLNGPCANNVRASDAERALYDGVVVYLDGVIEKAAKKSGVFYVDVSDAIENNQLCEGGGAEMAVNGLTAGNESALNIGPIGQESYHPNALGHSLLRNKILEKTNNFTAKNPYVDSSVQQPTRNDAADFIGDVNFDSFDFSYVRITNVTNGTWYKGSTQNIEAEGFAPNSQVSATAYSDPTPLGTITANGEGAISTQISTPDTLPAGYHTVVLSGENESGEKIELRQQIYLASSTNDIDGNGVNDSEEQCVGIGASGVDYDQDGIDDACDGYIGEPPALAEDPDSKVGLPKFGGSNDIIETVNQTNTNSAQGGQSNQSLQSVGGQTQTTAGGLQTGSTNNVTADNSALEYLSSSSSGQSLSVGVASSSSSSQTAPVVQKSGMSPWLLWILAIAFAVAAIWLYLKFLKEAKPAQTEAENNEEPSPVEDSAKPKKDKKKRKKKPNHH